MEHPRLLGVASHKEFSKGKEWEVGLQIFLQKIKSSVPIFKKDFPSNEIVLKAGERLKVNRILTRLSSTKGRKLNVSGCNKPLY